MAAPMGSGFTMDKSRRERKPNFSDAEILVILEGVYENRDVLNHAENSNKINKQKEAIYGQITGRVNMITAEEFGGSVLRSIKEVKKKWTELKSTAIKVYNTKTSKETGSKKTKPAYVPKESPYTQLVLDVIGGKVKQWPAQFRIGFNASNRSGPGRQTDDSSGASVSLPSSARTGCTPGENDPNSGTRSKREIKTEVMDEDSDHTEQQQSFQPPPASLTTSTGAHISSSSSLDSKMLGPFHSLAHRATTAKGQNCTFSDAEISILLVEYNRQKDILQNSLQSTKVIHLKQNVWRHITEQINEVADTGVQRTPAEVQRMWANLKHIAKKEREESEAAQIQGRPPLQESPFTTQVLCMLDGYGDFGDSNAAEVQEVDFDAMMNLEASSREGIQSAVQHHDESSCSDLQFDQPKKRVRKSNFTAAETTCLLQEVLKHMKVLAGRYPKPNLLRQRVWKLITEKVNRVSQSQNRVTRSVFEVRKRFLSLKTAMVKAKRRGNVYSGVASSAHDQLILQVLDAEEKVRSSSKTPDLKDIRIVAKDSEAQRKHNFSVTESEFLVNEIDKHRHVILSTSINDGITQGKRRQAWRIITERLNRSTQKSSQPCVRRTARDVRKRWLKMKKSAWDYQQVLDAGNAQDSPPPLLFHRIMDILRMRSSSSQGQVRSRNNDPHTFSGDEVSAKDNSVDRTTDIHRKSPSKSIHTRQNSFSGDICEVGEENVYVDIDESTEIENAEGKKRDRKPNFSQAEITCLLDMYAANKHTLNCRQIDTLTNSRKQHIWQIIADRVSDVEDTSPIRTAEGIKKKWKAVKSAAVAAWNAHQEALSAGKKPPAEVPFMQRVLSIIGEPGMQGNSDSDTEDVHDENQTSHGTAQPTGGSLSALVLRHMKTLASICKDLKSHGIETGAYIIEKDAVLSCGSHVMKDAVALPDVVRLLDLQHINTDSHADSTDWELTPLNGSAHGTSKEENNQTEDMSSSQDSAVSGMEDKLPTHSDICPGKTQGLGAGSAVADNDGTDEREAVNDGEDGVEAGFVADRDAENIKNKLKRMLHSRSQSVDVQAEQGTAIEGSTEGTNNTRKDAVVNTSNTGETQMRDGNKPYKCSLCSASFTTLASLFIHIRNHERDQEEHVSLEMDVSQDFSPDRSTQHQKSIDTDVFPATKKNPVVLLKKLPGNIVSTSTTTHQLEQQSTPVFCNFYCSECGHRFASMDHLTQHTELMHVDDLPFPCSLCDMRFKEQTSLDAHEAQHTSDEPYNCHVCGRQFEDQGDLVLHKWQDGCMETYMAGLAGKHAEPFKATRQPWPMSRQRRHSCSVCGRRFLKANHLQAHMRLHTGEKPYSCDMCDATFTQLGGLSLHKKSRHAVSATQMVVTPDIDDADSSEAGFDVSSLEADEDDKSGNADETTPGSEEEESRSSAQEGEQAASESQDGAVDSRQRKFGCEFCGKRFFTSSHRNQHVRIHTGERPFKCDVCGFGFTQSTSLTVHKRKHTGERPYSCDICGYKFYCSSDVLSHKRKRHGLAKKETQVKVDKYRCDLCGKVFPDTSRLTVHQRKHSGEKPFACDQCDRRFTERHNLLRHKERHLGIKAYQCEVCGAKFTEKGNLKVHMRYHTGEKPFKCEFCGEGFYVTSTLKIHRRKHTGERPFLCDLCGASFTQGTKLRSHRRKHTGEKPYRCDDCGELFKEKQQLNIHQRKHTGEQPYRCSVCGKATQKASHLAVHMRLHTGEKPFHCEVCGDKFARSDVLKLHMKKHGVAFQSSGQVPESFMTSGPQVPQMSLPAMVTSNLIPPTMVPTPNMIPPSYQHMQL